MIDQQSFSLPRFAVSAFAALLFVSGAALAQEESTAEGTEPAATDTTATPEETPAASGADAPVTPAEAAGEVVPTVPVATAEEAPPSDAQEFDAIQVTGSRLRRTDYETAQPVVVISREDIERSGLTDITEILRNITVAGNNSLSPQQGRFALSMGESNIDLRNLGATHTLLLVNGRRWVTGLIPTQTSVSDFNTIPTAIIERIEVLKDGASAIYGSDAIAGVVNVITRKDFDGASLTYHLGQYFEFGDGLNHQLALNWGQTRPGTSAFFNINYTRQDEYSNQNHALTARPNVGPTRDSIVTPDGLFQFVARSDTAAAYQCPNLQSGIAAGAAGEPTTGGPIGMTQIIPAGLVLCQLKLNSGAEGGSTPDNATDYHQISRANPDDVYNRFADGTLKEPNQRTALYGTLEQQLWEGISFNFEALYNRRESTSVGQNGGLSGGNLDGFKGYLAGIPADQNPFAHDIGIDSSCGGDPTSPSCTGIGVGSGNWNIRRSDYEANNQEFRDTVDTFRLGGGFRGALNLLARDWSWDAGYIYSRSKIEELLTSVNYEKAGQALDPDCPITPGCVPLNLFEGAAGLTDAAVDFIRSTTYQRNGTTQDIAYANVATEFPFWDLLAGPVGVGIGYEFRKDTYSSDIDPIIKQGLIRLNTLENTAGAQYSREAYVELALPLLKDRFLAESVELSLAGRYSTFPRIDPVTTGKAGVRWQPVEDVLLRGAYSTGFRAPSVGELFLGASQSFDPLLDPCANPGADDEADQNCLADGTPGGGGGGTVITPYDLWQGNPELKPESSTNLTYGFIYSPRWLPDLNIGVDYYDIEIEDYVVIGQGQYFLDSCYKVSTTNRNFCDTIERSDGGDLLFVNTPYFNLSKVATRGYDIGLDYILPLPETLGRFKINLDSTYLKEYTFMSPQPGQADQVDHYVGKAGGQFAGWPRWKAGGYLNWQYDRVKANWSTRMAYHMVEPCGDLFPAPSLADLGLCNKLSTDAEGEPLHENKLKTIFYHNVSLGYALTEYNAELMFGINNVLDQDPVISRSLTSLYWYNYDPNHYEAPGRLGYVKVNLTF
jgi:iron complex outermembrane receptor protein